VLDRQLWRSIDWLTILGLFAASGFGLLVIYSASQAGPTPDLYKAQIARLLIGLTLMFVVMLFDYHTIVDRAELLYVVIVGLLIYLVLFGGLRAGTNRWLELGFGTLQPGELAKIAVVVFLAKYFSGVRKDQLGTSEVVIAGLFAGVPLVLIALQPDLGTAATIGIVFASIFYSTLSLTETFSTSFGAERPALAAAAQFAISFSNILFLVSYALLAIGLFIIFGLAILKGIFAKWMGWLGVVTGIVILLSIIPPLNALFFVATALMAAWFLAIGAKLYRA